MNRRQLDALQRRHLYPFIHRAFRELHPGQSLVHNWHIRAICKALEDVFDGRTRRLLITVPPRHLKSVCSTIGFSAWVLGRDPRLKIMTASYGEKLASDHSHQFRTLMQSSWYRHLFPHTHIDPAANRALDTRTTDGGGRRACSCGGAVTGFGADILIVDDLLKADDAHSEVERSNASNFFQGSLLSRLDDKQHGRVIVIQQRLHDADLAGNLLLTGTYRHLNLPAIAAEDADFDIGFGKTHRRLIGEVLFPAREPRETLEDLRREMGPAAFNAQYQQDPLLEGGGPLQWDWFSTYTQRPQRDAFSKVIQSWDTGQSAAPDSDPSVCLTFGYHAGAWLLLDVFRRRMDFPDLKRAMQRLRRDWAADQVIIERAGSGISLLQDLRREEGGRPCYRGFAPRVAKEERIRGQSPKIAEGLVKLPAAAPWLGEFRSELIAFPNARHDDQVDALSQFLAHISQNGSWLDPDRIRSRRSVRRR